MANVVSKQERIQNEKDGGPSQKMREQKDKTRLADYTLSTDILL